MIMSWHRKLHQVPEFSPEFPPTLAHPAGPPPTPALTVGPPTLPVGPPPTPALTVGPPRTPAPPTGPPTLPVGPPPTPALPVGPPTLPVGPPRTPAPPTGPPTLPVGPPPTPALPVGPPTLPVGPPPTPALPVGPPTLPVGPPPTGPPTPALPAGPPTPALPTGPPTLPAGPPTPPPTNTSFYGYPLETTPPVGLKATPSVGLIVGTVVGGLILLVAVGIFVIWYRRRNRRRPDEGPTTSDPTPTPSTGYPIALSQSIFSYEELDKATNGFSKNNFIGQGGFGPVHKGVLPSEKVVAVKKLKLDSKQGEREFRAEVEVISRIHHKHLVSLVGYCILGEQRLLVYDFVPNGNLEYHLHRLESPTMNWPTRLKIAIGSAKGLAYLHEDCQPKIIHRDIKAANILLDSNFDAKVSDFGLAKFLLDTATHISTRVMGTFGYLAPEYASSGQLTDKSDVFSLGVVLLELITGLRPFDKTQSFPNDSLVEWGRPLLAQALKHGNFEAVVDPRLQNDYEPTELARMVACAAACVRHMARSRPRMSQYITLLPFLHGKQIVRALEGNLSLDDPNEEISLGTAGNIDYDNDQYKEDLKKFRKMVPISHEQGSSECSGPSTDSALHQSVSSSES